MTYSIVKVWRSLSVAFGSRRASTGCAAARSAEERVRMAKACALVKTPEAIQFTN